MKSTIQRQLEIFSAALEHPAGPERDTFVAQACSGNEALRFGGSEKRNRLEEWRNDPKNGT